MKKLLGIIILGLLLSGCTSTKDKIASFQTQSPHDLCIRFLTLPAWNDYHYARINKIGMWSMEFDYPWDYRKSKKN